MTDSAKIITRRAFIRDTTCAALGVAVGLPLVAQGQEKIPYKTRVVLVRDAEAIDSKGRINADVIQRMLDQAVTTLLDKDKPVESWKLLIQSNDVVGIKSNVWGPLPTPPEVEQAIKKRVMDVGVHAKNIGIDDHGVLGNPIFLKATALINVRPLRTHHWAGIGGCLKNYIMFVPEPNRYHGNSCADLATIWKLPIVRDKTRLNVLVLLRPLFHGIGPHHFDSTYIWEYKGILVGTDPVALDAVGLQLLEAKRFAYFGKERPLKPSPHHVAFADIKHKLGTSDLRRIELVKLGWKDDILI